MDKNYDHKAHEEKIYRQWEESGIFTPKIDKTKKPFTIVLPPPNASGKMHTGNVLMIAIEDILIRWHRMRGDPTLWIPGTDHAGTETQITFERELKKQGKSRFDYDRRSLYEEIWKFVQNNKSLVESQIRRMGASVDWTRYKFTLDPDVVEMVCKTFEKMNGDGLVYRGDYMVNYCPSCGTTYADIEVDHKERIDPLYYVRYLLLDRQGDEPEFLVVATVRPEPIFADTHLAVNPLDKKRAKWIGRNVANPLTDAKMEIVGDEFVDPEFGTGIVKLTPAHDENDYGVAKKHNLSIKIAFDLRGRMVPEAPNFPGIRIMEARRNTVELLRRNDLIEKTDDQYSHSVAVCKAGHDIEPTILPNWFIRVKSLKKPAFEAVKNGQIKIYPKWRRVTYDRWMESMHDWAISRQNVWGIRIPVWYNVAGHEERVVVSFLNRSGKQEHGTLRQLLESGNSFAEIRNGLQQLMVPIYEAMENNPAYVINKEMPMEAGDWLPETDTFDTWFSSGQWPLATLGYPDSEDFKYFYPTDVIETAWEILSKWVSRMIMFGVYLSDKPPFEHVYLHGIVKGLDGRKMSKSLGNVINPEEYIEEFGVDALRMGLISGTANGKDFSFPRDAVIGYKKFANKLWNIARFVNLAYANHQVPVGADKKIIDKNDEWILNELRILIKEVDESLTKFRFAEAAEQIYQFVWHKFADIYIEKIKFRQVEAQQTLFEVLKTSLKLLHPFMPFVTEAVWSEVFPNEGLLAASSWPKMN